MKGALHFEVEDGPSGTLALGGCFGVPSGRAHKIYTPGAKKPFDSSGSVRLADIVVKGNGPKDWSRYLETQPIDLGEDALVFRIRASNTSHTVPVILPPAIVIPHEDIDNAPGLRHILNAVLDLAAYNDPMRDLLKRRFINIASVSLLTFIMEKHNAPISELLGDGFDSRIRRAVTAIHEAPSRPWTVEDLAQISNLSKASFTKRFKAAVGESPYTYVMRTKMNLACSYLHNLDVSIGDIAHDVGYQSEAAFINAFKRHVKTSPGQYRKRARKETMPDREE